MKTHDDDLGITIWRNEKDNWHRIGLPAFVSKKSYGFYRNHNGHRLNGPAIFTIWPKTIREWQVYGISVDAATFMKWLEDGGVDINNITPEDEVLIAIKWQNNM